MIKLSLAPLAILLLSPVGLNAAGASDPSALAFRYDESHVVIFADGLNDDMTLRDNPAAPQPAANMVKNQRWLTIETARVPSLSLSYELPAEARVGARYELLPGPALPIHAAVEKYAIYDSCGQNLMAILKVDANDLERFRKLHIEEFLARPAGDANPRAVAVARPRIVQPVQTERLRIEKLLGTTMRDYLGKIDYTAAPEPVARAWRGLSGGTVQAKLKYDVKLVSLGPKYGPRYFVRALWAMSGIPSVMFGLWIKPGDRLVAEELWPVGELQRFDYLEDYVDKDRLDNVPFVENVYLTSDGRVRLLQALSGHETADENVLEYANGHFKETGLTWAIALCD